MLLKNRRFAFTACKNADQSDLATRPASAYRLLKRSGTPDFDHVIYPFVVSDWVYGLSTIFGAWSLL
jgi:hypothetical protein